MTTGPHYLLGLRAGWRERSLASLSLAGSPPRLRLASVPDQGRPLVDAGGSFGGLALPRGVAVDAQERVWVLDGDQHLRRFDPCLCRFETLPCIGGAGEDARSFIDARALDLTCDGDLLVADAGRRAVAVFAVQGLALRGWRGPFVLDTAGASPRLVPCAWRPGDAVPAGLWQPGDVVVGPRQRVHVCDIANGAVHVLSMQGRPLRTTRVPGARRIAVDLDERTYVIVEGSEDVQVFGPDGAPLGTVRGTEAVAERFCPTSIAVDADGHLLLGDRFARLVRVARPGGDASGTSDATCVDTRLQSCGDLAFDAQGHPYACDPARGCIVQFEGAAAFATDGTYVSQALDSETWQCTWHRVAMQARVPAGGRIEVAVVTRETLLSDDEIAALPESAWAPHAPHTDPALADWDCLVVAPPGRYLWLRLRLHGDGRDTPCLCHVTVEYPRRSSADWLPAIYREEAGGGDFLARFLSIFDAQRDRLTALLDAWPGQLDPRAASAPGFLEWLAGWMGLALDRHWPVAQQRALLREAWRLYELRGTAEGLVRHLRLFTGGQPRVLEHWRLRRWLYAGQGRLGEDARLYGDDIVRRLHLDEYARIGDFELVDTDDPVHDPFALYAHRCTVYVPLPADGGGDLFRHTVARIVAQAVPAHVDARVVYVQPRLRVGLQALIGLDTVIAAYPDHVREGESRLGHDAVLGLPDDEPATPSLRVGRSTRLGRPAVLD
jgi:phage tail-like protein